MIHAQSAKAALKSGIYKTSFGKFTIGIDNGILSGFYEYYGNWDVQAKAYMQEYVFYIYGTSNNRTDFDIVSGTSGFSDEHINGKLSFEGNKKFKIVFKDIPSPGCSFNINENSDKNIFPLTDTLAIRGVAYIKSKKAPLYAFENGEFKPKKAYLVWYNMVMLKEKKMEYTKVAYRIVNTDRYKDYWIRTSDLQKPNPVNWGNF